MIGWSSATGFSRPVRKGWAPTPHQEAIEWGVTGAGLRAPDWNGIFGKKRPYSGYEQFDFDIPTGVHGDCLEQDPGAHGGNAQSLRIVAQCLKQMPGGPYKAEHPLAVPPVKDRTLP